MKITYLQLLTTIIIPGLQISVLISIVLIAMILFDLINDSRSTMLIKWPILFMTTSEKCVIILLSGISCTLLEMILHMQMQEWFTRTWIISLIISMKIKISSTCKSIIQLLRIILIKSIATVINGLSITMISFHMLIVKMPIGQGISLVEFS